MMISSSRIPTYAAILFLWWPVLLWAQDTVDEGDIVDTIDTQLDLFEVEEPMIITLTFDIKKYQKTKSKGEYMPAALSYHINDSLRIEKTIRLKARGAFRREYCSFAPFWLNIRKSDIKNQHLQDIKRMKVVTQCQNSSTYGEYVLKEYLVYRIYNILSSYSFSTRLVRMKYIDTGRKNKVTESWAFIIEPEELLAERVNATAISRDALSMKMMEPKAMDLVSLFQYMVGNADYAINARHNVKILGLPGFGTNGYTPVPYDFDYSGFVNTVYAIPGENLGIKSVTDRYFLGPCREDLEYQQTIDHIENHKEEILNLITSFPYLEERRKKDMIRFIEGYFELSMSSGFIRGQLRSTCR